MELEASPTSSSRIVASDLGRRLADVGNALEADALCFVGPLYPGTDDWFRHQIEHLGHGTGRERLDRLVVLLTTGGGIIETVQRIVETIRHHYGHVTFVVPNYAYSAGTVFVMSGDEFYIDYHSRLGPIDPQVLNARQQWVPPLGHLAKWEELLDKARAGSLTLVEAQLMIDGFDQAELYKHEQARNLSVALLEEWLARYKFKDWNQTEARSVPVTDAMRRERAVAIGNALNDTARWHSHGTGISKEVLQDQLKLKVDALEDYPALDDAVTQYDRRLTDYLALRGYGGVIHTRERFLPLPSLEAR